MDRFERLSQQLIQGLDRQVESAAGDCLRLGQLESYLTGELDDAPRARVDVHLEQCLGCLNRVVELRDLLHGLTVANAASTTLVARFDHLQQRQAPLWHRLAGQLRGLFSIRVPAGWMAVPVGAAVVILLILVLGNRGSLPGRPSGLSTPSTTELAERPSRDTETALQAFRKGTREQTQPTSPQSPLDVPTLVAETQSAVVLISGIERSAVGGRPRKIGSGFFIDPAGLVVTNYHVIKGSSSLSVQLHNGSSFIPEMIVFASPEKDFAILKVAGRSLPALRLGDSDKIRAGQQVVALGSPLGLENSVSSGVVSGFRELKEGAFIQTTAPVSEGSSGGPLLNMHGEVVGITARSAPQGQNVNFAIPINEIKAVAMMPTAASGADRSMQRYLEGVLHFNRQDYGKAEEAFKSSTELNRNNFDAWMDLGNVYYMTGEFEKEFAAYRKAVQLRPNSDDAHFSLATAHEDKGEFAAAAAEYRQTILLNPKHTEALFQLSIIHLIQGNRAQALEYHKKLQPLNRGMALELQRLLQLTKPGR
jgi:S1-C subfamily serine protease